jgi:hypothetical protein
VKRTERLRRARDASDLLARLVATLDSCRSCPRTDRHSAIVHITDVLRGQPGAQAYDSDRANGGGTADPTSRAALQHDLAAAHLREIDKLLRRVHDDVRRLVVLFSIYVPHAAHPKARRETARFNDPGCGSCARLPSPADPKVSRYEPPHTKTLYVINGSKPMLLCWFCQRWYKRYGDIPTVDQVGRHHRGETVRRPA